MTEQVQGQPTPESGQAQGGDQQAQGDTQERTFTQADLNKIAANEKREGRSSVLSELGFEDFDSLKETVEAYQIVEDEMQTSDEKFQKQIDKLTPKAEKAERYEKALTGYLEAEREGLPEHITALLDRMDPVEQLEYIRTNRDAIVPQEERPRRRSPDASVRQSANSGDPNEVAASFLGRVLQP